MPCILKALPKNVYSVLKKSRWTILSAIIKLSISSCGLFLNESLFLKFEVIKRMMTAASAKITFGFSNCVVPKGAMINGVRNSKKKVITCVTFV